MYSKRLRGPRAAPRRRSMWKEVWRTRSHREDRRISQRGSKQFGREESREVSSGGCGRGQVMSPGNHWITRWYLEAQQGS